MRIRDVEDGDLEAFFEHQRDPEAAQMAAFPSRERDPFMAHWAKIRADPTAIQQTIIADGLVAGNIGSWEEPGQRDVGYWIARSHWGRGVATSALRLFLGVERTRPLYACVAAHNAGSIRVLEKCGFRRVTGADNQPSTVADDGVEEVLLVLAGKAQPGT